VMEIQELRVLTSIVDTGGFKLAATQLGLSQPAISQSLSNLERKLGEKLLERTTPIKPTPIGTELLKHARYVLESETNFKNQLHRLKDGHLQTLSIAVDHLAANYYCPKIVAGFNKLLPEANIKIKRMPAREIIQAIKSEQFLVGIGPFQKKMEGLHAIKLLTEQSCLVTGKNNPNYKTYKHSPLQFLKETPLLSSYLDSPDQRPSRKKIRDYFKTVWEINDINLQLNLIKQGIGAAFIAKSFLDATPNNKNIVILDKIPFALIKKHHGLYMLQKNKVDKTVLKLVELITK
jgi:DNA-binding transcriptional LysR family regulator